MNSRSCVLSILDKKRISTGYKYSRMGRPLYEHCMNLFCQCDPKSVAARSGVPYNEHDHTFTVSFLDERYRVSYPDGTVEPVGSARPDYRIYVLVLRWLQNGSLPGAFAQPSSSMLNGIRSPLHNEFYNKVLAPAARAYKTPEARAELARAVRTIGGTAIQDGRDMNATFQVLPGADVTLSLDSYGSAKMLFSPELYRAYDMLDFLAIGELSLRRLDKIIAQQAQPSAQPALKVALAH